MSVGLLLVTHERVGAGLVAAAEGICGTLPARLHLVSIPSDLEPGDLGRHADRVRDAIDECDSGDGVLVLTDIYGATPDNLARHFCEQYRASVVSGVNLPMLLRVLNYAQQPLEELGRTALAGGREGVCRAANDF